MAKKKETTLDLTFEGKVMIVEQDSKGKVISSAEIPGETVLKCLMRTIEDGINLMITEEELKNACRRTRKSTTSNNRSTKRTRTSKSRT